MTDSTLKIHLKPRERIFINGAVLRVDRKVSIEFLNDVSFLLEAHVILEEDATTPLRQLYFVVQAFLIDPSNKELAMSLYRSMHTNLIGTFRHQDILEGLVKVKQRLENDRAFDALRTIRSLFPIEAEILANEPSIMSARKAVA